VPLGRERRGCWGESTIYEVFRAVVALSKI